MRSILWLLVIISDSKVFSEETNEISSPLQLQPQLLTDADEIYSEQKACDAYVGEAIVNTVEKGNPDQYLVPDNRYKKCMEALDNKKRDYITKALVGLNLDKFNGFPLRLSNKRLVTLPLPIDSRLLSENNTKFDIQQEICMTNKLCAEISLIEISNEEDLRVQQKSLSRCLELLDGFKMEYINLMKLDTSKVEKEKGVSFICIQGVITLPLPKNIITENSQSSKTTENPQIKPSIENNKENENTAISEAFALADVIYNKQKECDSIVEAAVKNTFVNRIDKQFPVPDEIYLQCKKSLDEKKREYIAVNLLGIDYYPTMFPMVLSSKQFVTLPVPNRENPFTEANPDFDIQQEICATNKLCLSENFKDQHNNEQENNIARCLEFLEELKVKYMNLRQREENEVKEEQELSVMCTEGLLILASPGMKEEGESSTHSKVLNRNFTVEIPGEESTRPKVEGITNNDRKKDTDIPQEIKKIATISKELTSDLKTTALENVPILERAVLSSVEGNNEDSDYSRRKERTKTDQANIEDKNDEITDQVKVLTENDTENEFKLSGKISKPELQNLMSKVQEISLASLKHDTDIKSGKGDFIVHTQVDKQNRLLQEPIEDNIVLMENDCKDLLHFGEQLLQLKLLRSLPNFEVYYNECIKRLDALKKIFILNNQLDVKSHENIFPLTLRSGYTKLLPLPKQFLKGEDLDLTSFSVTDYPQLPEFSRENDPPIFASPGNRKPFDDPAFISNAKFLANLKQEAKSTDSLTLSKVASILHMNVNHADAKEERSKTSLLY